ncbi:MAG: hypothetical protein KAU14_01085 [Thermoplasmata archaeon]|nr:hypothetical protein [Thermoplasmata archaeon]
MNLMKMTALLVVVLVLAVALAIPRILEEDDDDEEHGGNPLADEYIVIVEEPINEEEMAMVYALSSIVVYNGTYHPMYILEDGMLDDHELWNIEHSVNRDATKYLFSTTAYDDVKSQMESIDASTDIIQFNFTKKDINKALRSFAAYEEDFYYEEEIRVASAREALWVSGLAAVRQAIITLGDRPSFLSQEEVWEALAEEGIPANYVLAANPDDYMGEDVFYTLHRGESTSYHIPTLSAVAAEIAAYRQAYVVTDIDPLVAINARIPSEYAALFPGGDPANNDYNDTADDMYRNNVIAYGYYEKFRYIFDNYGPINYICLVGGAEALPQFEMHDYSGSESEGITSSDCAYGFLDRSNEYRMNVAVGRIVNFNVQGASNQIARTLGYDYLDPMVESDYYTNGDVNWKRHSSSWNGFEVADLRGQNTPGFYFFEDSVDEGFDASWWSTMGAGAGWSDDGGVTGGGNIAAELEVSHLVAYRGHGSWHASFYQWGYYAEGVFGIGDDDYNHIEGEHARTLFLPPISATIVSCENAKIHGLNYGGSAIDMNRVFATSWMYGGGIGLAAATEVSYSNIGQDISSSSGAVTDRYNWDINDLWYAGYWDNTLNGKYDKGEHFEEETSGAEAVMYTENRYIQHLQDEFDGKTCSPFYEPPEGMRRARQAFEEEGGMHWKEITMFAYYGEPAFKHVIYEPGENDVNRWH